MKKPLLAADPAVAADRANDDIGEAVRLKLYRSQFVLREAEQRAYDLFLQNLVKGTSHLSLGQEAVAAGFAAAVSLASRCSSALLIAAWRVGALICAPNRSVT